MLDILRPSSRIQVPVHHSALTDHLMLRSRCLPVTRYPNAMSDRYLVLGRAVTTENPRQRRTSPCLRCFSLCPDCTGFHLLDGDPSVFHNCSSGLFDGLPRPALHSMASSDQSAIPGHGGKYNLRLLIPKRQLLLYHAPFAFHHVQNATTFGHLVPIIRLRLLNRPLLSVSPPATHTEHTLVRYCSKGQEKDLSRTPQPFWILTLECAVSWVWA